MSSFLILRVALLALRRNLLRTGLTMLSLVIGVTAVITIVALGSGAHAAIEDEVKSAGTNLIIVSAGNWTSGGVRMGMGSSSRLTEADADAIRREVKGVAYVSPSVRTRQQLITGGENWSANVEGVGVDLPRIRSWPMLQGSFFGLNQVREVDKVCVIGTVVRDTLFGAGVNPVGRPLRIGSQLFQVVGVLTSKGQSSGGQDQDDAVFVPYTTAQKKLMGVTYLRNIMVSSISPDEIGLVAEEIRRVLRYRHEILPGQVDDFRVRTLEDIVALRTRTTRTMTSLLSGIAAVSLLVGGIGVMNIMLVSVTERTREIGIRLAVGARRRDVLLQFLAEATLLSVAGGVLGIALGYLVATSLTEFLAWRAEVAPAAVLGSFVFAAAVGIFFGWYPANKAAGIDPIDALRTE
ncbi:MAG: ABC transporter permease [Vicinamibacterales bacterium]